MVVRQIDALAGHPLLVLQTTPGRRRGLITESVATLRGNLAGKHVVDGDRCHFPCRGARP
jgi:hypothetical protein